MCRRDPTRRATVPRTVAFIYSSLALAQIEKTSQTAGLFYSGAGDEARLLFLPQNVGENRCVAGTLPGEQQSPGLLHLFIRASHPRKKKRPAKRLVFSFWSG